MRPLFFASPIWGIKIALVGFTFCLEKDGNVVFQMFLQRFSVTEIGKWEYFFRERVRFLFSILADDGKEITCCKENAGIFLARQ